MPPTWQMLDTSIFADMTIAQDTVDEALLERAKVVYPEIVRRVSQALGKDQNASISLISSTSVSGAMTFLCCN